MGGGRKAIPTKQEPQWLSPAGAGHCRDSQPSPRLAFGWWGYPDRAGVGGGDRPGRPPRPAMAAGVARATGGSSAVRTPARFTSEPPGRFGHGGSQRRSGKFGRGTGRPPGGGCKRALERTVLLKGGLQPPHSADATGLHDRRTGPDRRARPATASDRRRRLDRERGGPGRGRAVAGAASLAAGDDPRGQGGHRETARGLQTSLGKNVLFKGGLQPPGRSRAQSRSRTAWLPDPLRRGRGSPQRRPIPRNLRGKRRIGAASTRIFR